MFAKIKSFCQRFMRQFKIAAIILPSTMIIAACAGNTSADAPEWLVAFFGGIGYEEILVWLVAAISGGLGVMVNLYQWVKVRFRATDQWAQLVVQIVSLLITGALMWLTGALKFSTYELTMPSLLQLYGFVQAGSAIVYAFLRGKDPNSERIMSVNVMREKSLL